MGRHWGGRDSLALSCHQLFSSICPEEAYLAGTASFCPPIREGASTLDRGEEIICPSLDASLGASKPLTATQARRAHHKKLAEAHARAQRASDG